jgi:hypothetical protein
MDLPVNFKFDVRIRPRLLARGQLAEADVAKHLDALPDLQPQADVIDLAQPALTSPEDRERAAASRPSSVVARPAPVAPAERSAPVSIAPAAEPVDEGWDEDDDEDDVDEEDEDAKDEETKVEATKVEETKVEGTKVEGTKVEGTKVEGTKVEEAKAPAEVAEDVPKAAGVEEE